MFSFNFHRNSKLGYTGAPRLKRRGDRSSWLRRQDGMTLIELLVGMLIIAIASVGLMLGVTYGRIMLRNTMIADRALQELSNYMELWRGRIHAGMVGTSEMGGGEVNGEKVVLYSPTRNSDSEVVGKIFREPIKYGGSTEYNRKNHPYLTLEAYIIWERPTDDEPYTDTLRLKTSVIPYK